MLETLARRAHKGRLRQTGARQRPLPRLRASRRRRGGHAAISAAARHQRQGMGGAQGAWQGEESRWLFVAPGRRAPACSGRGHEQQSKAWAKRSEQQGRSWPTGPCSWAGVDDDDGSTCCSVHACLCSACALCSRTWGLVLQTCRTCPCAFRWWLSECEQGRLAATLTGGARSTASGRPLRTGGAQQQAGDTQLSP